MISKLLTKGKDKVGGCRHFFANLRKLGSGDNGKEFSEHQKIPEALNAQFYFAHPYCSWERGLNENTNGLIRQYFPKKTSLETIDKEHIAYVQDKLNNRHRKSLNFQKPANLFHNSFVALGT